MNAWAGIALAVLGLTIFGVSKLSHFSSSLAVEVSGRVHKVELTQITIAIDALIKNPTNTTIYIVHPYLTLLYQGKRIGSSTVSDDVKEIAAFGNNQIKNIMFPLKYLNLTSVAASLVKKLQDKTSQTELTVNIKSYIVVTSQKLTFPITLKTMNDRGINYKLIEFNNSQNISI